jgi:hypothetical protein
MLARVNARTRGKQDAREHHCSGVPAAGVDKSNKQSLKQGRIVVHVSYPCLESTYGIAATTAALAKLRK